MHDFICLDSSGEDAKEEEEENNEDDMVNVIANRGKRKRDDDDDDAEPSGNQRISRPRSSVKDCKFIVLSL